MLKLKVEIVVDPPPPYFLGLHMCKCLKVCTLVISWKPEEVLDVPPLLLSYFFEAGPLSEPGLEFSW